MKNAALKQYKKKKNYKLLLWLLPFLVFVVLFSYVPLFGWSIAFFQYTPGSSLSAENFVGLKYFRQFFMDTVDMWRVIKNTLIFAVLGLVTMPLPMIFAILLNEVPHKGFSKFVQSITTFPNFISWVIVYSLAFSLFSTEGVINSILMGMGIISKPTNVLSSTSAVYWFQTCLGIWKGLGWSSIVYLAAISGIPQELYEAASVDGAGRFQQMLHVTLPGIAETFIVLLLLSIGNFISVGFDQYFIFQNPVTLKRLEVLDLYVYRLGLINKSYSYSTAIGMIKSLISLVMIFGTNQLAKKIRGNSII
ncbi:sugar ABC transporter permease [uncultured Acetatifactor sp.]|uniref:ABC transporter permease n=1 Tax=uncultured Acetatifactor sp. TaxID=1671927 RepID=UPI0025DFF4F8|nr:ABC transporter permease subunit [uncultured Acetatifactor sp.]